MPTAGRSRNGRDEHGSVSGALDLDYPASNRLAADVALHAGKRRWRSLDRETARLLRKSLREKGTIDPDFWSVVGETELDQDEALAGKELASARQQLEKAYEDLHRRVTATRMWASVYADGTRGLHDDSRVMADVKAQLEDLKNHDASPDQRPKIEKAIKLLPTLEGNPKAQDQFLELVLSLLEDSALDKTEGLPQIRQRSGSELLARLSASTVDGTRGIGDVFGTIAGGVGRFLNLTTWYVMKERSGAIGATGVAEAVRALHAPRRCGGGEGRIRGIP